MNTRINYRWAEVYDESKPNNGFSEKTDSIVTDGCYDFSDFLRDNGVDFEYEEVSDIYYVIDEDGNRTGEAYQIMSEEETDEELRA